LKEFLWKIFRTSSKTIFLHKTATFFITIKLYIMKIAIIGATGFVGSAILNELANRNHNITAIARNPKETSNATWVAADIFNVEALADILKGHDVIINAYNPGWTNPNIYDDFVAGSKAIQEAVKIGCETLYHDWWCRKFICCSRFTSC
jgi:NAD(P)-dependent dehydrogenase (short-subunit alcohol dehydrogenase family)